MAKTFNLQKRAARPFKLKGSGRVEVPRPLPTPEPSQKFVSFKHEGVKGFGFEVDSSEDGTVIQIALPDGGRIFKTPNLLTVESVTSEEAPRKEVIVEKRVVPFEAQIPIEAKFTEVRKEDDGPIVDYRDVIVEGLASTFQHVTPADRDGDYILEGAFDATLKKFMKNPVMLADHTNSVHQVVGSYSKVGVTKDGLAVTGVVSNAPGLRDLRFKLVEGHIKAFSIGGFFFFQEGTWNAVEMVELFEISIVAIPANPDALFTTRSLTLADLPHLYNAN